jgi:polar amino acid transport system substrate-binding protein
MHKFKRSLYQIRLTKQLWAWLALLTFFITYSFSAVSVDGQTSIKRLKTATYGWRPFIYENLIADTKTSAGLDVQLADMAFTQIGYEVIYEEEMSWDNLLSDLHSGKKDIVISALKRPDREKYAYYSDVFRLAVNVLYLPKTQMENYQIKNAKDIISLIEDGSFRLGVVGGYAYGDGAIDAYIRDSGNTSKIVTAENDEGLFNLLTQNKVDGFLVDQIVGADIAYRHNLQSVVGEYPVRISELPYYVIFSKKTISPTLVKKFNASIANLRATGKYSAQVRHYLFPVLLSLTTGQRWYFLVELTGVISFAASGLILAHKGGYDIFGAFVLAALPGVGGGVLRDIVARRSSLGVMRAPIYLIAVICTVVVGYLLIQIVGWLKDRYKLESLRLLLQKFGCKLPITGQCEVLKEDSSWSKPMDLKKAPYSAHNVRNRSKLVN